MKGILDRYGNLIAIVLIVLSLVGGTFLILKKGSLGAGSQRTSDSKDQEIADLKNKISELEAKNSDQNTTDPSTDSQAVTSPSPTTEPTVSQAVGKINLNTASVSELDSLPGIGPVYAQRIIDYRNVNGPFSSVDQVQNVKGIGPKTLEKIRDLVTI